MAWYDITGNVADWFNTVGTLGTLGVAIAAYKKAPNWLKQKASENGIKLALNLRDDLELALKDIYSDYNEIVLAYTKFDSNPSIQKCDEAEDHRIHYQVKVRKFTEFIFDMSKIENNGILISEKNLLLKPIELCFDFYSNAVDLFQYQYELQFSEQHLTQDEAKDIKNRFNSLFSEILDSRSKLHKTSSLDIFSIK